MENGKIDAPTRLLERLRPAQEQIDRLNAEIGAALLGARLALNVPDDWMWDGGGWVAPRGEGGDGQNDVA